MTQPGAGAGQLEAAQVRSMFDGIASIYDALNGAMTAGLHHRWRARAADLARVGPGSRVLDVATGTGDLALELARRVAPGGEVLGSDFSEGMLARAREKAARPATSWRSTPSCASSGATGWSFPTPRTSSTPPRTVSGCATSPTSRAGSPRWCASCAPGDGSWCWR